MQIYIKTIRVMLIDDHPTLLWGLKNLIQGESPRMEVVGTAQTCEEARTLVDSLSPDVILLDLDLNGESSIDLIPQLLRPQTQILLLTGSRDQAVMDCAVERGVRGVLRKDASAEQILKAIEKVFAGEIWLDRAAVGRMFNLMNNTTPKVDKRDPEIIKQALITIKERKVIQVVLQDAGASNKSMADLLFISEHTLRNHLTSIYQKLNLRNRLDLYIYAEKYQLGQPVQSNKTVDLT